MELCSSTATLGSLSALHFLDYLSNVNTPADGFTDLALELVKLGKTLLDTRSALVAASQHTRYAINVPAIRQRLTQARTSINLLDHFIKKLVASQTKKGFSKMSQGFRMLFADTDLTKYTSSLILSREALVTAIGTEPHIGVEHDAGMTVGYQALAAVLGHSDIFSVHAPSQADSHTASEYNMPRSRNSSLPGALSPVLRGPLTDTSLSAVTEHKDMPLPYSAALQPLKHDSAYGSTGRPRSVVEEESLSHAVHMAADPSAVVRLVPRNRGGPVTASQEAALVAAVSQKNHRLAEQLLDKGVNPNASDSLLMVSIAHHDLDTLRCLLMFGGDPNIFDSEGISPLYACVQVSFMAGAQLLINYGADVNVSVGVKQENALALALVSGKTPFVQLLLKYCADPDCIMESGFTPLTRSIDESLPLALVDLLFLYGAEPDRKNRRGESALFKAISAGRLDIVTTLLEHGANPNLPAPKHMLWPAVHHPRILEMLLEHGADLKRAPGCLELATSINSLDAVQILLKYGVDVNAKKDGIFTPLCTAIRDDREQLVDILIAAGADPNLAASEYPAFKCVTHHRAHLLPRILDAGADLHTPSGIAETAIASNNKDALMILLKRGVNINARSSATGETALTKAISMGDISLIDLLLSNGADPAVRGHEWPVAMAVKNPDILARLLPHIPTSKIIKGAMEMAVVANQLDSVKLLLAKGIDVEEKNGGVFSPLTTSIREDRKDIFRYLLDHANADPNSPGEHLPIIKAIRRHRDGDLSYIRHLLTKGADINLMYRGWNAVLQAIDNGDVKVLQLLVDWAPPNLAARDEAGMTVYEIVKERGLDEEEKILCGRGQPSPDIADATARLRDVALAM